MIARRTTRIPASGNDAAGSAGAVRIPAYDGIVPRNESHHESIRLRGCRQHNLRNLDFEIPLGKLTVVTGPSGSGKSSLAFHTLYAEGQRRYVETFSPYVRQFFDRMDKPNVESIEGIPPAIAIEQKNHVRTTRSTVGTLTEINDHLKLLFARMAEGFDPHTGEAIRPDSAESAAAWAMHGVSGEQVMITFPVAVPQHTPVDEFFSLLHQQGYLRVRLSDDILRTDDPAPANLRLPPAVEVVQDRLRITHANGARLREALEAAFRLGKGLATVHGESDTRTFSSAWTNPRTGWTLRAPTPALFSFNHPIGACPKCRGFGRVIGIDLEKVIPDPSRSIRQGAIQPFQGERGAECQRDLMRCCKERGIDTRVPWDQLDEDVREWIYHGDRPQHKRDGASDAEALEAIWQSGGWYGIRGFFDWLETKAYKMHVRVFLSRYRSYTTCDACRGRRLQPEALCFRIGGMTLPDLWNLPVNELLGWFSKQIPERRPDGRPHDPALRTVLDEIVSRLRYLDEVGLGYLTLDRPTRTLSGGEVERVNLTSCLGAALTGTLFVLDEPTVGLHARDIDRLIGVMRSLCDRGNTLVVVEHERAVMLAADHLIDLGPGAGQAGGEVVYQGPPPASGRRRRINEAGSATSAWLCGEKSIAIPTQRRAPGDRILSIRGATRHNLRQLDADIPLERFVCLTGVSGSGKSTFAHDVVHLNVARALGIDREGDPARVHELGGTEHLGGVELVDQTAVARTPRSTPALFVGAFDSIRTLFCESDAAKAAGLKPGFFSFNSGDGRCDRCMGNGFEKVEMQFLSDLQVTCPDCDGKRYKASTLEYRWNGLSIADVLDLTADRVAEVFVADAAMPAKQRRLIEDIRTAVQPLLDVGLGYLKLGQPLNTLSGGESQRLKLCLMLAASSTARSRLLILDEPTTGLHFGDIERLLGVFRKLVDAGHSLLVIEHNLDVIRCADWILDLGPGAGSDGGSLVAQGTPETVSRHRGVTGIHLKRAMAPAKTAATNDAGSRPRKSRSTTTSCGMISLEGARHHNLKNISLEIPRNRFVVISGLSGSGKSTLAFDILFAEGQRRFLDSMSAYARQFAEQLEKPEIDRLQGLPPTVAIEQRVSQGGGKSTVATVTELWNFIRLLYSKLGVIHCPDCVVPVEKQSVAAIENHIRAQLRIGPVRLLAPIVRGRKGYHTEIAEWALRQGFAELLVDGRFVLSDGFTRLERFKEHDIDVVVDRLIGDRNRSAKMHASVARALEVGRGVIRLAAADGSFHLLSTHAGCPECSRSFDDLDPRLFSFNSPHGWCPRCRGHGRVPRRRRHLDLSRFDSVLEAELDADRAQERMEDDELVACPECCGSRLNPAAAAVRLLARVRPIDHSKRRGTKTSGRSISELARMTIREATAHFTTLDFDDPRQRLIARDILPEIRQRLAFLEQVGLGYLTLDRSGNTLSGGEAQRIRLAAQLGSNLRGVLYVLDEPTIGLHPRDNDALLATLINLRDHGNSLVVVEHDEDTIAAADHLIDLGPGAGRFGGEVVYEGRPPRMTPIAATQSAGRSRSKAAAAIEASPTLRTLATPWSHPIRGSRREVAKNHACLIFANCRANNLKGIEVRIPVGRLTVITGVSGSGKSTLMHECVAAAFRGTKRSGLPFDSHGLDRVKNCFEVDQSPIGKTSRSCPATYVKVFDDIRALFAQLPEARMRGFDASRFSFNTEDGRCPECKGNGRVKLEMDFLPPTWVHCAACDGRRYNPATLEVRFRGKTIGDVLAMSIDDVATFFESQPRIAAPLRLMADTGLGYLQLGQPSPTLSGGEAQRIKLVSELVKGRSVRAQLRQPHAERRNLYLIEEPTVGLHREDIRRLIDILHRLVDEGHTVVVVEHHMAVAAEADWILDLGPEAGGGGGTLVAQGSPETIVRSKSSHTAPFLAKLLTAPKPKRGKRS